MQITETTNEEEYCCSCQHNIRKQDEKQAGIYCECEIDGHYIGYVACFESVCDEYKAESEDENRDKKVMTRKEKEKAIDALKISAPVMAVTQEDFNNYIQTLNQVMDWLEQQPCEDAISRQAAISAIMEEYPESYYPTYFKTKIDNLPSVTPQPKTGHWIEYTRVLIPEPFNEWEQAWYCSECGYGNQECEDGSAWLEWKYCPNCGAKMAESEE